MDAVVKAGAMDEHVMAGGVKGHVESYESDIRYVRALAEQAVEELSRPPQGVRP